MSSDFITKTHGKWILAGEHAVLRGYGALVFPVYDKTLALEYQATNTTTKKFIVQTDIATIKNIEITEIITNLVKKASLITSSLYANFSGTLKITSNIPAKTGMGASAALCVAIARWFASQELIKTNEIYTLAKELENTFHGQSSGLDIAGVESSIPIYFKNGTYTPIQKAWEPNWQLSSCADTSTTINCVNKVKKILEDDSSLAMMIDKQMGESVEIAKDALENLNASSKNNLAKAMKIAHECFNQWGLITPNLKTHMQQLLDKGALAVKPTGSGGGGIVVSLWG
jgi:mevalonate kinase